MWSKLSYERRTYVLLGGLFLLLLIGYQTSISKAVEAYSENQRLKNVSQSLSVAEFSQLQRRYNELDSTYSLVSGIDYDKILISEIEEVLNQYKVEVSELAFEKVGSAGIDILTLTGSFRDLLKSMYYFERHFYVGTIFSAAFRMEKDNKTRRDHLYLDIYIQRMSDEKN